jgi:radical SAM protein with 4Fe4S-binding SPASM domain
MPEKDPYVRLTNWCTLKCLEKPYLYDIKEDELYQVDESGFVFLSQCDGTKRQSELKYEEEFLAFCLENELLELTTEPQPRSMPQGRSPQPSLRYLELQVTSRCNLTCRHCYLGRRKKEDLEIEQVKDILGEFEVLQGLRILLSGGEPLLYPFFWRLNQILPNYQFRKVLLTNGLTLQPETIDKMRVDEIQISVDGMKKGHELLRGGGTFAKTVAAARLVANSGKDLSIATMIHTGNLDEIDELSHLVRELGAREWGLDVPVVAGRMQENPELQVEPERAVPALKHAFGESYHGGTEGYACGHHICTIIPSGKITKCGFYEQTPLGHFEEGLLTCWKRSQHIPLDDLECGGCPYLKDCGGGCRYRAPGSLAPDPVMCALHGVKIK